MVHLQNEIDIGEDELKLKSRIYGRNKSTDNLTLYQREVNEAAYEIVKKNASLLANRKELMDQAQTTVRSSYAFKKGFSRSTSVDNKQSEGKKRKHEKTFKEDRAIRRIELTEKIKETKNMIRFKTLRRDKCSAVKEWKVCEKLSAEIAKLLSEKGQLERELALIERKEQKSKWHEQRKASGKNAEKGKSLESAKHGTPSVNIRNILGAHSQGNKTTITTNSTTVILTSESCSSQESKNTDNVMQDNALQLQLPVNHPESLTKLSSKSSFGDSEKKIKDQIEFSTHVPDNTLPQVSETASEHNPEEDF